MDLSEKLLSIYNKTKILKVLYVEDDLELQKHTLQLLKKIFHTVLIASNGKDGLKIFNEELPQIVITDIDMPFMDGLKLSKAIKKINSKVEIIITSAYDDKGFLLQAIQTGILYYLIKPLNSIELLNTLDKAIDKILIEDKLEKKYKKLEHIFAFQKNILLLIEKNKIKVCNRVFLDFFGVKNLKEFNSKFKFYKRVKFSNLKKIFRSNEELFSHLTTHSDELFKLKLIDKDMFGRDFLLTISTLPYNKDEYSLSFIAIDTNLDKNIFQREYSKDIVIDLNSKENELIEDLEKLKDKNEYVEFYNIYKGLNVFHNGKILKIYDDKVEIEVDKVQLLAFEHEKKTFIHSKSIKRVIQANVESVNFNDEVAVLNNFHYLDSSPGFREYIRVSIDKKLHIVYLENENIFVGGEFRDLSIKSLSLTNKDLAGLELNMEVNINFYLPHDSDPNRVKVSTRGKIFQIRKENKKYVIVVLFDLDDKSKMEVSKFISKRQLELIKEFKSIVLNS